MTLYFSVFFFILKAMYKFWLWSNQFGHTLNYKSVQSKFEVEAKITHQSPIYMER